jgi:hypothetical protein
VKRVILVCGAALLTACATPGVVPEAPIVMPNEKDVVWVTRAIRIVRDDGSSYPKQGLFACYRPSSDRAGEPVCYLAKYRVDGGSIHAEDLDFPGGPAGIKKRGSSRVSEDD